ncbi:hypothetical protein [Plastoroseomonas arctica]|uniref:EAL domain-containing protein n=1 Tax=Plastoroseomonas arctica TaxID=1509237 RepID=A0AAF1K690_9PROT|nr:hypothetical protein [Plastoroseomonas arctica]MBR0657039.1 hypothetical protein [Plastoroseomonas arctica]
MSALQSDRAVLSALVRSPLGTSDAVELAALVRDTVASGVEREVLVLRLSALPAGMRRGHHRRLLEAAWAPLRSSTRSRCFDLPNGDVCAVEVPPAHLLAQIRDLLLGALDGASSADGGAPEGAARIVRHLRLPAEAAVLIAVVEQALGLAASSEVRPAQAAPALGFTAEALCGAEKALAMADLSPMLRAFWACRLDPGGGAPQPLWEERRIDVASVCGAILPSHDPDSAPWLRRKLLKAIDRRILAGLARPDALRDLHASLLPLGTGAVNSAEFQKFDALLPAMLRGRIAIAFTAEEVLCDPDAFLVARERLRAGQYRVALEVEAAATLALVPPEAAGFDLVRLAWGEGLPALGTAEARALADALPHAADRMLLAEVDRPAAIAWGWEMGFRIFSGRLMERRRLAA